MGDADLYGDEPGLWHSDCLDRKSKKEFPESAGFETVLRKVILLIPLIYILPCIFTDKVMAVFLAEPVADLIAVSTTVILFYRQYRKLGQENKETKQ